MKFAHLLASSIFIFFVLYAPQPLLALFAQQFAVSPATSGSLMTATMLPLAIAPLFYGLLLTRLNPLFVLKTAMLMLAVSCLLFPLMPSFELLLMLRFIQGLTLPAALTAMTTYISTHFEGDALQSKMGWYIGSTIAGGFLGRALAAAFAEALDWESFFYTIAIALTILAVPLRPDKKTVENITAQPMWGKLKNLKQGALLKTYGAVFCMFFCFAGLLNYLPFILRESYGMTNTRNIGLVYSGYLIGALASIATGWLNRRAISPYHLLTAVFAFYCATLILMQIHFFPLFLVAFTAFCASMFVIHATAAPLVNKISDADRSVTNGVYVSFYYCGGAIGSYAPGLVYQSLGVNAFLLVLLLVCLTGFTLMLSQLRRGTSITRG